MLKSMRKKGFAKKVLWFVAVVIIISFGFFGTANYMGGGGQPTFAGKVFGKKVSFEDFRNVYTFLQIQAQIRYGDNYNNIREYLNFEQDVWNRLVMLHEADKRKIKIPNTAIIQQIERYPFFQRNGQFDSLIYNDLLRYGFRIKARKFEEHIRDSLKINQLFLQETASVQITEKEVRNAYQKQNEKVQISYAFVSPDLYTDEASFNEEKAQSYYEENNVSFLVPSSINIDYLVFEFPDEEEPESEEINAIREKATAVSKELAENPNLKDVAEKNGLEVKTSGFFSQEEPDLSLGLSFEILSEIFTLKQDELAGPFESSKGMYIVQMTQVKEAYIPDYEEAKEKVKKAILREEAMEITREKTQEFLEKIKADWETSRIKDFPGIAKSLNLEIYQTPVFNRGQYLPKVGISNEFQDAAFDLKAQNPISNVVETAKGFCILHLDEYFPADEKEFEEQRVEIAQDLISERRNQAFNAFVSRLRARAGIVSNVAPPN